MKEIKKYLLVRIVLLAKRIGFMLMPRTIRYQKFAIVCSARTGSTWLHTLLNSHPKIVSKGEVVRINHQKHLRQKLIQFAFPKYPSFVSAVGLKVFYDDPIYQEALREILVDREVKIILLTRQSKLAQYVSLELAKKNIEWTKKNMDSTASIPIHTADFLAFKKKEEEQLTGIQISIAKHLVFRITYEELVDHTDEVLHHLQEFLGVAPRKLRSLLHKQGAGEVINQISNWEEVKNELHTEIQ